MTRHHAAVALAVVLAMLSVEVAAVRPGPHVPEDVAFVLDVVGYWRIRGGPGTALTLGSSLPESAQVERFRPADDDKIVVALYTGDVRTFRSDSTLPRREQPGLLSRLWLSVRSRYQAGYVHSISRGRAFTDTVVPLDEQGRLHLRPLCGASPPPCYVSFTALDGEGRPTGPRISAEQTESGPVAAQAVSPGIWRVSELTGPGGDAEPTGALAWVVVVRGPDYQNALAKLDEARRQLEPWQSEVDDDVIQGVLRAYMLSLRDELEIK